MSTKRKDDELERNSAGRFDGPSSPLKDIPTEKGHGQLEKRFTAFGLLA